MRSEPVRPLLCCVLLAACAELRVDPPGVCGNNVVERELGEDCDLIADPDLGDELRCGPPDGTPRACHYVCGGDTPCPDGWSCFADGVCRHPSGRFVREDEPHAIFRVDRFYAGRFAGGAEAQVLGVLDGDLQLIALGEDEESPARSHLALTGVAGDLTVAAADEDDAPLVFVPVREDGALALHVLELQRGLLLSAMAARSALAFAEPPEQVLPLSRGTTDALMLFTREDARVLGYVDEPGCRPAPYVIDAPVDGGPLLRPRVSGAWVASSFSGASAVSIAALTSTQADCPVTLEPRAPVVLPGAIDDSGPFFADLDADDRVELIAAIAGQRVAVAPGTAAGFGAAAVSEALAVLDALPDEQSRVCSGERFLLAVADLNGDHVADFVTEDGVFVSKEDAARWSLRHQRTRGDGWAEAVVADFDGDGVPDVAATTRALSLDCEPAALELLRGSPNGSFRGNLVPGVSAPERLRTGDFDGDGIADLALLGRNRDSDFEVAVLYGDRATPLAVIASVGDFERVSALESFVRAAPGVANPDSASDLVVVPGAEVPALAILQGTPERSLLSPLTLEPGADGRVALAAGALIDGEDDGPDLLVAGQTEAWSAEGSDVLLGRAPPAQSIEWNGLRVPCTTFVTSRDQPLAVAVDGWLAKSALSLEDGAGGTCPLFERAPSLAVVTIEDGMTRVSTAPLDTEGRVIRKLEVADLDLDDHADAAISYAFRGEVRQGSLEIVSGIEHARAMTRLLPETDVLSFALVDTDRDEERELAVLTADGIFLVDWDEDEERYVTSTMPVVPPPDFLRERGPVQLEAADADGDGLEDLILLYGEGLFVFLTVPSP